MYRSISDCLLKNLITYVFECYAKKHIDMSEVNNTNTWRLSNILSDFLHYNHSQRGFLTFMLYERENFQPGNVYGKTIYKSVAKTLPTINQMGSIRLIKLIVNYVLCRIDIQISWNIWQTTASFVYRFKSPNFFQT